MTSRPSQKPLLSIVVPLLNEVGVLPGLVANLAGQRGVAAELILSDGGSTDGTQALAAQLAGNTPFPLRTVDSPPGRGRQLNAGATAARGEFLLFLHADSAFSDPLALASSLEALRRAEESRGPKVAGHFALRFARGDAPPSAGYYYYEAKARLGRAGSIHGDQGFLLRRDFFERVGPFEEGLPALEETRLAEVIRKEGEWLLLPAEIETSPRRFEVEGLRERQTLNALIMNFAVVGWPAFFSAIPGLYRSQDRASRLRLAPFWEEIRCLMGASSPPERKRLWRGTGGYVRSQAWQIPFAIDCRRNFQSGYPPGTGPTPFLDYFDRRIEPLLARPFWDLTAMALTWCWFHLQGVVLRVGWRERP